MQSWLDCQVFVGYSKDFERNLFRLEWFSFQAGLQTERYMYHGKIYPAEYVCFQLSLFTSDKTTC